MKELPKAYEPPQYEDGIYQRWEASGFFNPDICIEKGITKKDAPAFSIVLPPPNVTGTLHIGHAVMLAVEDVMVRFHRMKGDRTLWVPGTDHAAIATQEKVERMLWNEEKKTRHDLGRDAFLQRVEAFAQQSHDRIVEQTKKMGTSLDWSREYYSLDDARNLAVRTAFTRMYKEGLIYRGDRIVNWDPKMQSNVSDIEVVWKEEKAPFYYLQYGPFVIGTARPETKFGDKYIVMHPDDERYAEYKHGQKMELEWINGSITATIIKDEAADPEFGTGVMTITPWHDATDFFIAERHGLDREQIIGLDGTLLPVAGEFAGMDIGTAREKVVEKLKAKGLLVKIDEEYVHNLARNSRGGGVIEPQIMKQWWVDVDKEFSMGHSKIDGVREGDTVTLQKLMQHAVREKQIQILPERFEKNYFNWVDNLLDWCISRQLWYGHRIPAWYKDDEVHVGIEPPQGEGWTQDPDTLDTWFSAGLFSFSPLGWPDENHPDLKTYHPTTVIETGYDILTFWLVRMILMSTYHLGEVPFRTVYLHGLVRDEQGRKMSKSLDNIIDPLDVANKFGTDAVRLSLLIGATPGNDSRLSEDKIGGFRNFTNKLWNISRFVLLNIQEPKQDVGAPEMKTLADQWIIARLHEVVRQTTDDLEHFRFSQAGERLRDFTWGELADWYLEIAKIEKEKDDVLNYVLNTLLKLWHPFMPFVTERIWQEVYGEEAILMVEAWPVVSEAQSGIGEFQSQFTLLQSVITGIRSIRTEYTIPPGARISVSIQAKDQGVFEENADIIRGLARVESLTIAPDIEKTDTMVGFVAGNAEVFVDLAGAVDLEKEKVRIEKEIGNVEPFVRQLEKKLGNKEFTENAPAAVVEKEQQKLAEAKEKLIKLTAQKEQLS